MTTNAPTAKVALISMLQTQTGVGLPLEGVSVDYAFVKDAGLESIYGGGYRFTQTDEIAESPGIMVLESVEVSLYIRVIARPKTSIQETDERARVIGNTIGGMLKASPHLAGANTFLAIRGGVGDYDQDDDSCTSILAYNIAVGSHITY